jgi:hypothetical protein
MAEVGSIDVALNTDLTGFVSQLNSAGGAVTAFGTKVDASMKATVAATSSGGAGMLALATKAAQATAANKSLAASTGSLNTSLLVVEGLAHHVTDAILAGQSPLRAMMSELGTLATLGGSGLGFSALKEVGPQLLASLINPLSLAALGFGAAAEGASLLWNAIKGGADAADLLKQQDELLKQLKAEFKDTDAAALHYGQTLSNVLLLKQQSLLEANKASLNAGISSFLASRPGQHVAPAGSGLTGQALGVPSPAMPQSFPLDAAVKQLQDDLKNGTPDIRAFREEISAIALDSGADSQVRALANSILALTDPLAKQQDAVDKAQAALRLLTGQAQATDPALVGLANAVDTTAKAAAEAEKSFRTYESSLSSILAKIPHLSGPLLQLQQGLKVGEVAQDAVAARNALFKSPSTADFFRQLQSISDATAAAEKAVATPAAPKAARSNPFATDVRQITQRTQALQLEAASVGEGEFEQVKLNTALQLEQHLQQANIPLTSEKKEQIDSLATAYANAKVHVDEMARAQKEADQTTTFAGQQFISLFEGAIDGADSFTDALKNVRKALEDAILQGAILGHGPLAGLLGTAPALGSKSSVGGLFGLLQSSLLGKPATTGSMMPSAPSSLSPARQSTQGDLSYLTAAFANATGTVNRAGSSLLQLGTTAGSTTTNLGGLGAGFNEFGTLLDNVMGGAGSFLGMLGSGLGQFLRGLGGSLFGGIGAFAGGTDFAPGGLALVGEHGPELVNLPRGSKVFPHGVRPTMPELPTIASTGMSRAAAGAGAAGSVRVTVINKAGADVKVKHGHDKSGPTLDVILERKVSSLVARDIASGHGPISKALEDTYPLRRGIRNGY